MLFQKFSFHLLFLTGALMLVLASCKKEKINPQEVITTISLHVTGPNGFDQTFVWEDKELDGSPIVDEIQLPASGIYACQVRFYDRSGTNDTDLTGEIVAESSDHLLLYTVTGADVAIAANDADPNGKPIGLSTDWTTGLASEGNVRILLKHMADKDAPDPSLTGETDVDISFPVKVQ